MPTDIWSLPKDPSSGVICGSYFLRHSTEITGTLGFVAFEQGRSVRPLSGRELLTFVATMGHSVDLEPADDAAREAMGVEAPAAEPEPASQPEATAPQLEAATAPEEETAIEPEPEPEPEQPADEPHSSKPRRRGR